MALELGTLHLGELLALSRRSMEVGARRYGEIAETSDPTDAPLQELLGKMALRAGIQARSVEEFENQLPEESRLGSQSGEAMTLIRSYLTSLSKRHGEGPMDRDIALFMAESLEEELARFHRALAEHARESRPRRLLAEMSERELDTLHYLREVILEG